MEAPPKNRTVARAWRGHGAGVARAIGNFWFGWRGRGAGMSCDPWTGPYDQAHFASYTLYSGPLPAPTQLHEDISTTSTLALDVVRKNRHCSGPAYPGYLRSLDGASPAWHGCKTVLLAGRKLKRTGPTSVCRFPEMLKLNIAVRAGLGETATPASGPRPVRVRFFEFYRAPRVRSASSASAAVSPWTGRPRWAAAWGLRPSEDTRNYRGPGFGLRWPAMNTDWPAPAKPGPRQFLGSCGRPRAAPMPQGSG
eukprot:gene24551-biopygen4422